MQLPPARRLGDASALTRFIIAIYSDKIAKSNPALVVRASG
jgi:hypothetical protein